MLICMFDVLFMQSAYQLRLQHFRKIRRVCKTTELVMNFLKT